MKKSIVVINLNLMSLIAGRNSRRITKFSEKITTLIHSRLAANSEENEEREKMNKKERRSILACQINFNISLQNDDHSATRIEFAGRL